MTKPSATVLRESRPAASDDRGPGDVSTPTAVTRISYVARHTIVGVYVLVTMACGTDRPVGPTVDVNDTFELRRGQTAVVASSGIRVEFVDVLADFRCPADAICIQAGDATIQLGVSDAAVRSEYVLHTGDLAGTGVVHGHLRVELLRLDPYPLASRSIPRDDYRATLRITAV